MNQPENISNAKDAAAVLNESLPHQLEEERAETKHSYALLLEKLDQISIMKELKGNPEFGKVTKKKSLSWWQRVFTDKEG